MKLNKPYSWNRKVLRILNGRALARMIMMRWMNIFRCTTVNLRSVHTLCTKFNESVYTLCTVYTLYTDFLINFRRFRHGVASFKSRKQHILEFSSFKVIRQTVGTQPPAVMSYVEVTNYPNLANHPAKNASRKCPRIDWPVREKIVQSAACTPTRVRVYPLECTHKVHALYTQCTHANNVYNFGAGTVRQYHMSAQCMATSDIQSSTSSSGFSIRIFLWSQICPFCFW